MESVLIGVSFWPKKCLSRIFTGSRCFLAKSNLTHMFLSLVAYNLLQNLCISNHEGFSWLSTLKKWYSWFLTSFLDLAQCCEAVFSLMLASVTWAIVFKMRVKSCEIQIQLNQCHMLFQASPGMKLLMIQLSIWFEPQNMEDCV